MAASLKSFWIFLRRYLKGYRQNKKAHTVQWVSFFMLAETKTKEGYRILPDGRVSIPEVKPKQKDWWIKIPKRFWFKDLAGLNPVERCLLISLRLHQNLQGTAYPSFRRLANELGISKNTAHKHILSLAQRGLFKMERAKKNQKWYYKMSQIWDKACPKN